MNILITGTSKGLGEGLARYYLNKGYIVIGLSRSSNTDLRSYENFTYYSVDLSDLDSLPAKFKSILVNTPKIDLAILNAGILGKIADMRESSLTNIKKVMDTNVWSNKILIDNLVKYNIPNQIVAISSGAAISGSRGWNAYSLSKAALNMLISLYADEIPEVHFSALAPGLVDTQMQEYISSLPEDKQFPTMQRLKKARGTADMPKPNNIAPKIAETINKIQEELSGGFFDVRRI
ncbi:MAG TPA: SDR family NAD(P)-dependent oxidoreductase [Bacteroidales bacterium]|nr:SDR family NAD(P)-dependent oxidoreductase [Bacteroidales bacterium]